MNGTLTFLGEHFDVKVKIHGKTPNFHQINDQISLSIKSEKPIWGRKKFRFIIYERVRENPFKIELLAQTFNLYYQKGELIHLKVNDKERYLYYWEDPLKKEFLVLNHLINPQIEGHKSPIVNYNENANNIIVELEGELNKKVKNPAKRAQILKKYLEFNHAIEQQERDSFHSFFDVKYIASFEAARTVGRFTNHGFIKENLYFALDTNNFLFYPVLHRDNYFGEQIPKEKNVYTPSYYEGADKIEFMILKLCSRNEVIAKEKEQLMREFNLDQTNYKNTIDSINAFHNQLSIPKWPFIGRRIKTKD